MRDLHIDIETYSDYLKTEHWRRTAAVKRCCCRYTCEICGAKGFTVHHLRYRDTHGSILFREDPKKDLCCLCSACHEKVHSMLKNLETSVPLEILLECKGKDPEETFIYLDRYTAREAQKYWPQLVTFHEDKDYQHIPDAVEAVSYKWLASILL